MFAQEKPPVTEPSGAFRERIRRLAAAAGGICLAERSVGNRNALGTLGRGRLRSDPLRF